MNDTPLQPQPAYGVIKARGPFRRPGITLAGGEVLIDLRARGGAAVLEWFKKTLGWSAFTVEVIDAPAPTPTTDLNEMAARTIAELNAQVADLTAKLAAAQEPYERKPGDPAAVADPIGAIAAASPADLEPLPGIGEKRAVELIEAARGLVAARTPPTAPAHDH